MLRKHEDHLTIFYSRSSSALMTLSSISTTIALARRFVISLLINSSSVSNFYWTLSSSILSMTWIVEPIEATSTIQKSWKKTKIWLRKCHEKYWRFWRRDRSAVIIFLRLNRFLRANYLTYFERHTCSSELAEFNAVKIIEKHRGLT